MLWVILILSFLLIISSLYVILSSYPVNASLALIFNLFLTAILYIILNQEFIAAIQVLVYAGAIIVLFLFIVMLLNLGKQEKTLQWSFSSLLSVFLCIALALPLVFVGLTWDSDRIVKGNYTKEAIEKVGSIELFSETLFYQYILAFEFISILLLVAAIGTFVLGKDEKPLNRL